MRISALLMFVIFAVAGGATIAPTIARAADCYSSTIVAPSPFMGNNDEVFKLADGSLWQVKYEYEYMYEYHPDVVICPSRGVLAINGKSLNVVALRPTRAPRTAGSRSGVPANAVTVVFRVSGCDYFIADGRRGLYILQWFGGRDPVVGDAFVGYESGFGFKDVIYIQDGSKGRLWADDYLLSRDSAVEKISDKCR